MNQPIASIILAAGLSSRMGKLKALLPWRGKTLIEYQIEQMQLAGLKSIYVVLGHKAEEIEKVICKQGVKIIRNNQYLGGKSSSIRKGVQSIDDDQKGVFVSAVDQPVLADTLKKIVEKLVDTNAPIVIPVYKGKRGHPILFANYMKEEILNIREETMGLRDIVLRFRELTEYVPVNDPSVLLNFNRPEDYEKHVIQGGLK